MPRCVHFEYIVGYIGTCQKCGQVRDYTLSSWGEYGNPDYKAKSRKGGIARQQPKVGVYE